MNRINLGTMPMAPRVNDPANEFRDRDTKRLCLGIQKRRLWRG
jgi:hypothetical protein